MLEELKEQVYQANLELPRRGLVLYTWGNVSGIDREKGLVVIKPSGVEYDDLKPQDLVVLDLAGNVVEGDLNPSSDTKTHLELYRVFPQIGGVVHTHSTYAVAWAQAGEDIPCYGTTHADYFYGPVPCARGLTATEVEEGYEESTGKVIVETFQQQGLDPVAVPGVLCRNHGPFTWGKNAAQAVYHAAVLEEMAKMALLTRQVNSSAAPAPQYVQDKCGYFTLWFTWSWMAHYTLLPALVPGAVPTVGSQHSSYILPSAQTLGTAPPTWGCWRPLCTHTWGCHGGSRPRPA